MKSTYDHSRSRFDVSLQRGQSQDRFPADGFQSLKRCSGWSPNMLLVLYTSAAVSRTARESLKDTLVMFFPEHLLQLHRRHGPNAATVSVGEHFCASPTHIDSQAEHLPSAKTCHPLATSIPWNRHELRPHRFLATRQLYHGS